jgi:hypothetical protein
MMVTDPGLTGSSLRLLYRVRLHARQNRRAYPLSLHADRHAVGRAVEGGYLARLNDDPHFVTVTEKGEAYLDRLMRAD